MTNIEKQIKELSIKRYQYIDDMNTNKCNEIDLLGNKIYDLIIKNKNDLSIEFIFVELSKLGHSPNLIYDDNGHWAVVSDGFQNVSDENNDTFISSFFIKKDSWKDTIREALDVYLSE